MIKKPNRREILTGAAPVAATAALPVMPAAASIVEATALSECEPFTRLSSKYSEGTWEHEEDIENQTWRSGVRSDAGQEGARAGLMPNVAAAPRPEPVICWFPKSL